MKMAVRLDVGL